MVQAANLFLTLHLFLYNFEITVTYVYYFMSFYINMDILIYRFIDTHQNIYKYKYLIHFHRIHSGTRPSSFILGLLSVRSFCLR